MNIITETSQITQAIAKANEKWVLYILFSVEYGEDTLAEQAELEKAAPYLKTLRETDYPAYHHLRSEGRAWFVFDTELECYGYFHQTVGDNGPTNINDYNGSCKVFAMTCDPFGELQNENA